MVEKGGQWNLYYCYGDRLGSIVAVTDKEGNVLERYAYTPWGERRDPSDWTKPDGRTEFFNNRGFTGHEHLDTFNLIDMGGRMYDPMLGTFLSIDPYIQAPDRWLNYNRYLYCYGNPLSYTDPSGENPVAIIGAAVGAASGATAGFLNGSISTWINGGSFGEGILAGLEAGAYGAMSGYVLGGLTQGITNHLQGKNFWTGKAIGKSAPSTGSSASSAASQSEKFPPNDGALGSWHEETLQPGTVVDRYGGTKESSVFASPEGTSLDARSLLEESNDLEYDIFKIIKPVRVKSSIIAPWNGHAGGGIQYKFERPILELMDQGFIIKINK